MAMKQNPDLKEEEQQLEENEAPVVSVSSSDDDNEAEIENHANSLQIVLYNPQNIPSHVSDDVVSKEIVPVSVSDPDPVHGRPQSIAPRVLPAVGAFTVQCAECYKWRLIPSKEKYEEIREHILEKPFMCSLAKEWRPDISCDEAGDIEQDGSMLWAIDKPNIAQAPIGWERELRIRGEGSVKFADVYYISPTGKRLRSMVEIQKYLVEHPTFLRQGITLSQFSFRTPKPLQESYVRKRVPRVNPTSGDPPPVLGSPLPDNPTPLQLGGPSPSSCSYSNDVTPGSYSNDVTPPAPVKFEESPKRTLSSDSFHNQPKRFKIKGPSVPPNEVSDS